MEDALQAEQPLPLALLMARNNFQVDPAHPLGRQSAGTSFLKAYLQFSANNLHRLAVATKKEATWFHAQAQQWAPGSRTQAVYINNWGEAGTASGALHIPDPQMDQWAWRRMPWGDGAFSLVNIVHTLCSASVQRSLGQFSSSPVRSWDALICTSSAAQKAVTGFLERQEEWIKHRHQGLRFERPILPVIPLGTNPDEWGTPENKKNIQQRSRQKLNISLDAEIVLMAGRLDLLTKTQPAPMLRALAELEQSEHPKLELLIYGEAPTPEMKALWFSGAKKIAPNLKIHWIPGRDAHLARVVRWAADVFVSLSDNPQETFGITPLEAMAAGLPCLVSDWDGYRDTVIQPGESEPATGLRIKTRLVEGLGKEQSHGLLHETLDYTHAVGQIAQGIAVDLNHFKKALSTLLSNTELRTSMGDAGQKRVQQHYAWRVVMEQWRELTSELRERREHGKRVGADTAPQLPPWLPETSVSFGCFASEVIPSHWNPEPPDPSTEANRLDNPFQSWDSSLLKSHSPRRRGWWLKEGLIEP